MTGRPAASMPRDHVRGVLVPKVKRVAMSGHKYPFTHQRCILAPDGTCAQSQESGYVRAQDPFTHNSAAYLRQIRKHHRKTDLGKT